MKSCHLLSEDIKEQVSSDIVEDVENEYEKYVTKLDYFDRAPRERNVSSCLYYQLLNIQNQKHKWFETPCLPKRCSFKIKKIKNYNCYE